MFLVHCGRSGGGGGVHTGGSVNPVGMRSTASGRKPALSPPLRGAVAVQIDADDNKWVQKARFEARPVLYIFGPPRPHADLRSVLVSEIGKAVSEKSYCSFRDL